MLYLFSSASPVPCGLSGAVANVDPSRVFLAQLLGIRERCEAGGAEISRADDRRADQTDFRADQEEPCREAARNQDLESHRAPGLDDQGHMSLDTVLGVSRAHAHACESLCGQAIDLLGRFWLQLFRTLSCRESRCSTDLVSHGTVKPQRGPMQPSRQCTEYT